MCGSSILRNPLRKNTLHPRSPLSLFVTIMTENRRQFARWSVSPDQTQARLRLGSKTIPVELQNISIGGVAVRSQQPVDLSQPVFGIITSALGVDYVQVVRQEALDKGYLLGMKLIPALPLGVVLDEPVRVPWGRIATVCSGLLAFCTLGVVGYYLTLDLNSQLVFRDHVVEFFSSGNTPVGSASPVHSISANHSTKQ